MSTPQNGSTDDTNDTTGAPESVAETSATSAEVENISTALTIIEEQADARIRRMMHDGRMFFSVIDVIAVLTDTPNPRSYWSKMKQRITDEGFRQLWTQCPQLKLPSRDGKNYRTDAADTETLLRIIQSVPSPKAEPVKQWLARVGAERLEEVRAQRQAQEADAIPDANTQTNADIHRRAASTVQQEIAALRANMPRRGAPALEWALFFHAMGDLDEQHVSLAQQVEALQAHSRYVEGELDEHTD